MLVRPDKPEDRTHVGLYLPQTAVEKEKIQSGYVMQVGPGIPLPDPGVDDDEPWKTGDRKTRYIPMQAEIGDYALFLKKSAIEIKFENDVFLVVPQAAILVLARDAELL